MHEKLWLYRTNDNPTFCPSCGTPLERKKRFLIFAGILGVVSSLLTFAYGIVLLTTVWLEIGINDQIRLHAGGPSLPFPTYSLFFGILSITLSAYGLLSAIMIFVRKFFAFSLFGLIVMFFVGLLVSLPVQSSSSWQVGLPIGVISALSLYLLIREKSSY